MKNSSKTNGDVVREMSNEQIARLIAEERMMPIRVVDRKFNLGFDLETLDHAMYCVLLEWLNREVDKDE